MPYTPEELQSLPFWQSLQSADEVEYASRIEDLTIKYNISGSAADMVLRDDRGIILAYEPSPNGTMETPMNKIIVRRETDILRADSQLDATINRDITELI